MTAAAFSLPSRFWHELTTRDFAQLRASPLAAQAVAVLPGQIVIGAVMPAAGYGSIGIVIAELFWQLRGEAEKRQVAGAKVALQHNLGLGGAAVVTMYRKPAWK